MPARLSVLDGLLTDPAECLNALFAPLTSLMHKTAASSPQPPESAGEPSRDAPPVNLRTRQAEQDTKTAESPGVMGGADVLRTTPSGKRTALSAVPNVFSPPDRPVTFPMQTDALPQQAAGTVQSENHALPDALTAWRDLTAEARTSLTLPAARGKHGPRKPETLSASGPAASATVVPRSPDALADLFARSLPVRNTDTDGNTHKHDTRQPFLLASPQGANEPFSLWQKNAEQNENGQDNRQIATPTATGQAGAETTSAPLRLMQGVSPLAAMLQAHVQPLPVASDPLPASSYISERAVPQSAMPPDPFRPVPVAPPDMEALIQALEAHLELEFVRTYGTSGR